MAENEGKTLNVDAFKILAESARERFESRRSMEWNVCVAVWSTLVGIGAAIVGAKYWDPSAECAIGIMVSALVIVVAHVCYWMPYINRLGSIEIKQNYFWERCILETIRENFPEPSMIAPSSTFSNAIKAKEWELLRINAREAVRDSAISDVTENRCPDCARSWCFSELFSLHRSQYVQAGITLGIFIFICFVSFDRRSKALKAEKDQKSDCSAFNCTR